MHPTQGAKQDSANGSWFLLSHPVGHNRIGERGSICTARMLTSGYTIPGRFSVTQTHERPGSAQRNETQAARKWSGPWGRESQVNRPQRNLRVDNETWKGKKWWLSRRRPHRQKRRGGDGSRTEQGPCWGKGKDLVGN